MGLGAHFLRLEGEGRIFLPQGRDLRQRLIGKGIGRIHPGLGIDRVGLRRFQIPLLQGMPFIGGIQQRCGVPRMQQAQRRRRKGSNRYHNQYHEQDVPAPVGLRHGIIPPGGGSSTLFLFDPFSSSARFSSSTRFLFRPGLFSDPVIHQ